MDMSVSDLIKASTRLLGNLGNDITLTVRESKYPLEALNLLLDSWSTESLILNQVTQELFGLTVGKDPHTWGLTGDFNSDRPIRVLAAKIRIPGGVDMDVPIFGWDDYAAIRLKSLSNTIPQYVYIDNAYPLANVYIYPIPSAAYQMLFFSEKPLTEAAALTTTLSFPPGYLRAIKYALAVEIAHEYHIDVGSDIKAIATNSIANIKRANRKLTTSQIDPAILSPRGTRYNIYRDQ